MPGNFFTSLTSPMFFFFFLSFLYFLYPQHTSDFSSRDEEMKVETGAALLEYVSGVPLPHPEEVGQGAGTEACFHLPGGEVQSLGHDSV